MKLPTLCALGVLALTVNSDCAAFELATEAQLWYARTAVSKEGYIDGLCDAYRNIPKALEGELFCNPDDYTSKAVQRFCSARYVFKSGVADPTPGIRIFDQFYADKNHSELPTWTVLASYNDRVCRETTVLPRLATMQAKLKCVRVLGGMTYDRYSEAAIAAQDTACRALK